MPDSVAEAFVEWAKELESLKTDPGIPPSEEVLKTFLAPPAPGLAEDVYWSNIDASGQPFYRFLPSSWRPEMQKRPPLIVFLHGYSPNLNLLNWASFPAALTNAAERLQAAVAMPFARGNTDFQGIGEQDVFRVIGEMESRYGTDPDRVVLVGYSMGGMGALTIARRFPERFAGVLVLSGRGDYYDWQRTSPEKLPPWEREMVDDLFLRSPEAARMKGLPVLAYHGEDDVLNPPSEIMAVDRIMKEVNPEGWRLALLPNMTHWLAEDALSMPSTLAWMRAVFATAPRPDRPAPQGRRPGEGPSLLQNALLSHFRVLARTSSRDTLEPEDEAAMAFLVDWYRYAQHRAPWWPLGIQLGFQGDFLDDNSVEAFEKRENEPETYAKDPALFVFGEPEKCPLLATMLERHGVRWTAETITIGGRTFPRENTGFWLTFRDAKTGQTQVMHCGIPWGKALPPNHKFDFLPDILVYTPEAGRLGINVAVAAAKSTPAGVVWY